MAFRVVMIESEVSLQLKYNNLLINKGDGDIWIPLEDISVIVIDNLKIQFTVRLMSTLAEHNIGVIICNMEHLPIGFYCSYDNHSRVSKMLTNQIGKDQQFYDSFWKQIIFHKISNQMQVLKKYNFSQDAIDKLNNWSNDLADGDPSNREAHSAKVYFNTLMGTSPSRGNDDILLNSGLDYGYAVIRAYIARLCVAYGLNSQLGIHHKNEFNRFNLVDDLMEPVRPFVDLLSYELLKDEKFFTCEHRRKLVNLLNHKVFYKNQKMYLANMLEEYVSSYAAFLSGNKEDVVFPEIDNYIGEKDGD
ncbi:type II CRISPR-associated endonuclease Cas1 [Butyrivibrio sp. AC2005]|uniref:type II CRISPR-associated endonuclease Cas1 n=1 Tax=Butyrivibrio sp. AC2005 TaxID=1280672 RepID=UPI0003F4DAEA|nr:type II CRISPR-associated endonuclease Cas1 [Butyrivibrio sp. AC2005]